MYSISTVRYKCSDKSGKKKKINFRNTVLECVGGRYFIYDQHKRKKFLVEF